MAITINNADEANFFLDNYKLAKDNGDNSVASNIEGVISSNTEIFSKDDSGNYSVKSDAKFKVNAQTPAPDNAPTANVVQGLPVNANGTVNQSLPNQQLPPVYPEPGTQPLPGVTGNGTVITGENTEVAAVNTATTAGNADGTVYTGNMSSEPHAAPNVTSVNVPGAAVLAHEAGDQVAGVAQATNNATAADAGTQTVDASKAPEEGSEVAQGTQPAVSDPTATAQAEHVPSVAGNDDPANHPGDTEAHDAAQSGAPVESPTQEQPSTEAQPAPAQEPTQPEQPSSDQPAQANDDDHTAAQPAPAPSESAPEANPSFPDDEKALYDQIEADEKKVEDDYKNLKDYEEKH